MSEKVTKQSMTKLNGADDDEKTIQELMIYTFHPFSLDGTIKYETEYKTRVKVILS